MKLEIRDRLVTALESGEYLKGKECLRDNNNFVV